MPWLAGWQPYGLAEPASLNWLNQQASALGIQSALGCSVRFHESQGPLSASEYELSIARTGCVPTRAIPHDWFNALAWLAFPRTKRILNLLQYRNLSAAAAAGVHGRSKLRDAVTLFDENGAVFITCDEQLADALSGFEWERLFVEQRQSVIKHSRLFVCGHALIEKLLSPYPGLCAHAVVLRVNAEQWNKLRRYEREGDVASVRAMVDGLTASWLFQYLRDSKSLQPLPVLGMPGWWSANEVADFYDNSAVFRPGRRAERP